MVRALCVSVLGVGLAMMGIAFALHGRPSVRASLSDSAGSFVPMLGSTVASPAQLKANTAEFGHMPIVHTYYPGLPAANAWTGGLPGQAIADGSAIIVSFNASPQSILSGSDDASLSHFFDTAPTGHPIYYSYIHEPEGHIARGEFSLADYKAAWAHVVNLADQVKNPDLHSILILMAYDLKPASHRNWQDYLPGGGIISTLGWDAYPAPAALPQDTPPSEFMGAAVAASQSVNLPFGFAEFGTSTPNGRPAELAAIGSYLMKSGALFGTLFDSPNVSPPYIVTDSASINVWRGFVAASVAGVNNPDPPDAPAPAASPSPAAPPVTAGPAVSSLALSPAQFTADGQGKTVISFQLSHAADVTICMLRSDGSVARHLAEPGRAAGTVQIPFQALQAKGVSEPAGTYKILVVASDGDGSSTAEQTLTLTAP